MFRIRLGVVLRVVLSLVFILVLIGTAVPVQASAHDLLSEQEAGTIAITFIAGEISGGRGWNGDTRVSKIIPLYSEGSIPIAYSFELATNGVETGYVIVSAMEGVNAIHEFSYCHEPAYYEIASSFDRVYLTAPLEYAVTVKGSTICYGGKPVKQNATKSRFQFNAQAKKSNKELRTYIRNAGLLNLDEWMVGYTGQITGQSGYGGIFDPYAYVNDRYGTGWTLKAEKIIASVPCFLQDAFEPGVGNCTLSSLTAIFKYYRYQGKTRIPLNQQDIYYVVKGIATSYGYTPENGTPLTKIDNIIDDVWNYYDYTGHGWTYYTWTYSTFTSQVDNLRPSIISMSSGYYADHSVTLVGYMFFASNFSLLGVRTFFGTFYATNPKLRLNSNGLIAPKDSLILFSLYQDKYSSRTSMNFSMLTPVHD